MTSGNSRIDAVSKKYVREGAPRPHALLRGSYPSMPGNSAPHIMSVAYDYFNATVYRNRKNDAALRVDVTYTPAGPKTATDQWCYSQNSTTGELIAFPWFKGGTSEDFEHLCQAMTQVSNRWVRRSMPDAATIESWRQQLYGAPAVITTPAASARTIGRQQRVIARAQTPVTAFEPVAEPMDEPVDEPAIIEQSAPVVAEVEAVAEAWAQRAYLTMYDFEAPAPEPIPVAVATPQEAVPEYAAPSIPNISWRVDLVGSSPPAPVVAAAPASNPAMEKLLLAAIKTLASAQRPAPRQFAPSTQPVRSVIDVTAHTVSQPANRGLPPPTVEQPVDFARATRVKPVGGAR